MVKTHGYGGYTRGCRCDVCRAAKAERMRTRRAEARTLARKLREHGGYPFIEGITHGRFGYEERGCRCLVCMEARAVERRGREQRRLARVAEGVA